MTRLNTHIAKITIHTLAIPFRRPFKHGSAERLASDNIVLSIELGNGLVGYGETLARAYVTGETPADVIREIQQVFVPLMMNVRPESFGEVMAALETLPLVDGAHNVCAARCAVELAMLDVYGKLFDRDPTMLTGWIDQPRWEPPGSTKSIGYSGIIGLSGLNKVKWLVRLWRWLGLRDIKVKVGDDLEFDRLEAIVRQLSRRIRANKAIIRVDANGVWRADDLAEKIDRLEELGVLFLEQPTVPNDDASWADVQQNSDVDLIADESLVSFADAERLASDYRASVFNIRIAKQGGLLPAMRMAAFAYSRGLRAHLGCLVGETAILTRAGQWFASIVPELLFAEGNYGMFLMKDDITPRMERFRYHGAIPIPKGPGLGVNVDVNKLRRYAAAEPISLVI